jgi:bacteriorhodopsin
MKRLAQVIGVVFLIAGIAGFIPALCPNGLLLGLFAVNGMHNIVHILSGILALAMAFGTEATARNYFRIVGVVYALVTVLGFVAARDGMLMGMSMNMADNFLHLGFAIVFLWVGFLWRRGAALPPRGGPAPA